jgi:hypothetical protein
MAPYTMCIENKKLDMVPLGLSLQAHHFFTSRLEVVDCIIKKQRKISEEE